MRKQDKPTNTTRKVHPAAARAKKEKSGDKPQRLSARDAMARRKQVTFGKAYVREVVAGTQRDFEKQLVHAMALGLGTPAQLRKMEPSELRAKLAEKIKATPAGQLPQRAEYTPATK